MLSQLRRGHHHEFDGDLMAARTMNDHGERWKSPDRANSSVLSNNILPDVYTPRSNSSTLNPDLSRAFRVDAHLLAIVRIEDRRNNFYSAEVVARLRQKEQTQKFINKPCSLFVADRHFIIFDRATQVIAETIPLENVDPTCVYSDEQDTLNDIFMYRVLDRHLSTPTTNQIGGSNTTEATYAVVFKCLNKESKLLVDNIRNFNGKLSRGPRSARSEPRSTIDRRVNDADAMAFFNSQPLVHEPPLPHNPTYIVGPQHSSRSAHQQYPSAPAAEHYKRLTDELNKCLDDIESFVRHIEATMEYTKELERDHRRKDKKSSGLKQMVEKLPDDKFFVDILQKFKHSFNLLGELKHRIHSPNAPDLIHYLLSPLQFILYTLSTKHANQIQLAHDIWLPSLTPEAKELLFNCLTSKEHEILWNLGPAWVRSAPEIPQKLGEYRPVFFEGRPVWFQEQNNEYQLPPPPPLPRAIDERQQPPWSSARQQPNQNNNNNASTMNHPPSFPLQSTSALPFDTSTVDRSNKTSMPENYTTQFHNENTWAIERKRAGAKICAVKADRQGQNTKELSVRQGELIEIEDSSKNWWRAKNFRGDVGHVPRNILEELELEPRSAKSLASNTSGINSHRPLTTANNRSRHN